MADLKYLPNNATTETSDGPNATNTYVFPDDLGNGQAHIQLVAFELTKDKLQQQTVANKSEKDKAPQRNSKGYLFLPIPESGLSIEDNNIIERAEGADTLAGSMTTVAKDLVRGFLDDKIYNLLTNTNVVNLHAVNLYRGVELRTYSLTWKLIPKNEEEAKRIEAMVKFIRKNSMTYYRARAGVDAILKPPACWTFAPVIRGKRLYNVDYLLVQKVGVSYDQDGGTSWMKDGKPFVTKLDITFAEIHQSGAEDID